MSTGISVSYFKVRFRKRKLIRISHYISSKILFLDHIKELLIYFACIEFLIYDRGLSMQCFCAIFDELKDQARA